MLPFCIRTMFHPSPCLLSPASRNELAESREVSRGAPARWHQESRAESGAGAAVELGQQPFITWDNCNKLNLRVLLLLALRESRYRMLEKGHSKMGDLSGAGLLGRISCDPPALWFSQLSHSNRLKQSPSSSTHQGIAVPTTRVFLLVFVTETARCCQNCCTWAESTGGQDERRDGAPLP